MRRTTARRRPDRPRALSVEVQLATRAARLPRGSDLASWVGAAGGRGAVTIRLVGWPESRRLNERFRGKPGPTNVLAFPAPGAAPAELGDLAICLPLVHREAREQGKTALQHLAHLVVHGTLHLLGYDHDREPAARRMEARERSVLRRLGFPDPYRAASAARQAPRRRRPA
jgi:probable rRNA maturation factor